MRRLLLIGILTMQAPAASASNLYTLVSDSPQFDNSGFGFSGTITTDGRTGVFSDVSFIKDWSITLETPGFDGNSSLTLTPSNSPIQFFRNQMGNIEVTSNSIMILQSGDLRGSALSFGSTSSLSTATSIDWQGPSNEASIPDRGIIGIVDNDDTPFEIDFEFGDVAAIPVATAVPEPSALFIWSLAMVGLGAYRYRRSRI